MNIIEKLKENAIPLLKPYARRISLFGSFARGEHTDKSDIDLLLELKPAVQRPVLGLKWFRLENELAEVLGRKIEMFTEKDISPHLKPIVDQDKVLLYEEK